MDDRYVRWMIRQHFLNQMMPPPKSHNILGSNFLWDLFMCHMWFKAKDSAPQIDFSEEEARRERIREAAKLRDERTWKEAKEVQERNRTLVLNKFMRFLNYKPKNILLKLLLTPIQLYLHATVGFDLIIAKYVEKICNFFHIPYKSRIIEMYEKALSTTDQP